ncbi:MAG: glucose 1-dehydrogenase [Chitinivibrionales bacterium]
MGLRMAGKTALVTGGASGIGASTASLLLREGAQVCITDVNDIGDQELLHMVSERPDHSLFIRSDVTDSSQMQKLVHETIDAFGTLDYAFNNAGIEGKQVPTAEYPEDDWDRVISINLKGVWLCMRHQIAYMVKKGYGSIVNCSSVAGLSGFVNLSAYTASKHAIIGLTKSAALEYAKSGIRINAVCPGVIRTAMVDRVIGDDPQREKMYTDMEPIGRMGAPREIAEAVLWLFSDDSSFVTGHPLVVDGAMSAA